MNSTSNLYTYADTNLLIKPEKYMYSAYHGSRFLKDYHLQRAEIANVIFRAILDTTDILPDSEDLDYLANFSPIIVQIHDEIPDTMLTVLKKYFFAEDPISRHNNDKKDMLFLEHQNGSRIDTYRILKRLAIYNEGAGDLKRIRYFWLSNFIRRFEVSKKLYDHYTADFKKDSDNFESLTNYALLSALSLAYHVQHSNFKMLNASLKINDLLSSTVRELNNLEALLLSFLSIRLEISLIHKLADSHGVTL